MNQVLWEQLRQLIANHIGFRIRPQDTRYLSQKVSARIESLNLSNLEEYYNLLHRSAREQCPKNSEKSLGKKEWKILTNAITNGESFFFRDRGQFELLNNTILPEIIAKKRQAKQQGKIPYLSLKVWSAGCSTGEEVYSLAMLISELIPDPAQWQIVIIGTDINQDFLKLAREGVYKQWSFRLTNPLLKTKYFIANGKNWQVKPHIQSMVSFYQDNLIDVNRISHYNYGLDLVLCRNVFIYFDANSIAKAVTKIASTLSYGGYFISGHAELQAVKLDNFQVISFPESIVYKYLADDREITPLLSPYKITQNHNLQELNQELIEDGQNFLHLSKAQNLKTLSTNTEKHTRSNTLQSRLDSSEIKLQEIEKLLAKNEYDNVIKEAQRLIQQHQKSKESYYLIARAYADRDNLEQARKNCDRSLEIDSMDVKALLLSAQIAARQHNYRQAKELLKKIIYLKPKSLEAYLDLAEIYSEEKDLKRSQKMYKIAYDILQELPQDVKINYRGKTNFKQLVTFIKPKL